MSSDILNTENKLNGKITVIIFSAFSLLFGIVGYIITEIYSILNCINNVNFDNVLSVILGIFYIITTALICAATILYVFLLYKKLNIRFFMAIVFVLLGFTVFFEIISYFSMMIATHGDKYLFVIYTGIVLSLIIPQIPLLLAIILALCGVKKPSLYFIPLAINVAVSIDSIFDCITNVFYIIKGLIGGGGIDHIWEDISQNWGYYFGLPLIAIGNIAICIALIILVSENIPLLVKNKSKIQNENTLTE